MRVKLTFFSVYIDKKLVDFTLFRIKSKLKSMFRFGEKRIFCDECGKSAVVLPSVF
ncbi:hypothetical protein HMPREF9996_02201 [Aggregatibacter actinomycetemcomitans Y4]|nr:hypothetical protein HMPREF9996_02201 [Aggregatibacter actinomycetemcomitans Y4]KYK93194.1 hypothetical protein SA269_04405 [Aggregatibacter actinomycetemcomitans serotype d str. SA269]